MIQKFIKKHAFLFQVGTFYFLTLLVIFIGSLVFLKIGFPISIPVIFILIFSISYFAPFLVRIFLKSKSYNGKLKNLIVKYIQKNPIEIKNIYVRKSKSSNAFACSFWKNRAIVYNSHTLEKHPWKEIRAITAHEIGHHINNDPLFLTSTVAILTTVFGLINFAAYLLINAKTSLIYLPVLESLIIYPIFVSIQRWRECLADRYAYKVLGNPEPFADFFKKVFIFSERNGVKVNKNPSYISKIFFTHPPIYERIALFENK